MNKTIWPTHAEVEDLAQKASMDLFTIEMMQVSDGWLWTWLHTPSGMTFEGFCDCEHKAIAFVCALQDMPVVFFDVDVEGKANNV